MKDDAPSSHQRERRYAYGRSCSSFSAMRSPSWQIHLRVPGVCIKDIRQVNRCDTCATLKQGHENVFVWFVLCDPLAKTLQIHLRVPGVCIRMSLKARQAITEPQTNRHGKQPSTRKTRRFGHEIGSHRSDFFTQGNFHLPLMSCQQIPLACAKRLYKGLCQRA